MLHSSRKRLVASAICKRAGMRRPAGTGRFAMQPTVAAVALPTWQAEARRSLFGFGGSKSKQKATESATPAPLLAQEDLFHPLSQSPFLEMREKAKRVREQAYCPVSLSKGQMKHVEYECPNCGWPTHYSRAEWEQDTEHGRYWPRLREVNEDEHDLRSGRELGEFNALAGPQPYEEAISMASWDVFFYTRGFPSIDSDRSRRHVSKLLTFPITVGTVLHESSPYNTRNQRLTPEGLRSLTALRQSLHPALGAKPTITGRPQEPIRLFILGARAESSLPPHVWQQLSHLFQPNVAFHIYFIGPDVLFTHKEQGAAMHVKETTKYGVPAFTTYISEQLSLTSIKAPYDKVHDSFGGFDPYNDVFFSFSPGFGFPDEADPSKPQALTNWSKTLSQVLSTKAPLFCTGFSPADVERDVLALDTLQSQGTQGEFDWILTPGENTFRSDKWEILEADPRVAAKANWGIWGIRGRLYEVDEKTLQID